MANYRTSRIVPTVLTIIIIIVAIAGLVALGRLIFSGGGSSNSAEQIDMSQQNLLDTTANRAVSMTVRGPIVADEDFRSYRIIVSPSSRTFEAFTGYLDQSTARQVLPNNTSAYSQFVNALDKANLVKGTPFEGDKNNVLGICATGKVYEFKVLNGETADEMLWTSTCSGSSGSLRASVAQLSRLFLDQIPEGSDITASLKL
ncbi:MAG: hypothetical protein ACREGE_04350 [Candidatus Microsaccharimonas sp.]